MKTLRLFGVVLMAVMLSINLTSCGSDDDDDGGISKSKIIGTWEIQKITVDGQNINWDGYPYFVITDSHVYFTDDEDIDRSDYSTYTYNESTGVISMIYVNGGTKWSLKVVSIKGTEAQIEGELDEGYGIIYCKKIK